MSLSNNTNLSNEDYLRKVEYGDCLSVPSSINTQALMNNLKFGQSVHYDSIKQEWVVETSIEDLVTELKDKATESRFENMEFALDEEGRPDGLKNKQEMVLTIASDIANSIGEMAFEEAKQILEEDDWVDIKAMELLKESKKD